MRTYTLGPHYGTVTISFKAFFIDTWDSEWVKLYVDASATPVYEEQYVYTNGPSNICGSGAEDLAVYRTTGPFAHTAHTLKLTVTNTLNEALNNEAFGFKDIIIAYTPCHPTCDYCSGPYYTDCTACTGLLNLYASPKGQCINPCPDGWYASANVCYQCYVSTTSPYYSCTTCDTAGSSNCLSCGPNTYLQLVTATKGYCVTSCPAGYYGDTTTWTCQPCYSGGVPNYYACATCNGGAATNCLSCNTNTFLYPVDSSCIKPCPTGWWGDIPALLCKPCYAITTTTRQPCRSCFGGLATSCNTCNTGNYYFAIDHSCLITCPNGYYATGLAYPNNICNQCYQYNPPTNPDGTCATCTGPNANQCLSCNYGWYLDLTTGKCVATCPIGYWADHVNNVCSHCYQAPLTTSQEQSCYTCVQGTVRDCTSCSGNSYFYAAYQSCLLTCPSGWWGDITDNLCKQCYQDSGSSPYTCATCNGVSSNNCLSCNTGTFLDPTTNTCLSSCPTGYYGDTEDNKCKLCYISSDPSTDIMKSCKECLGPSKIQCTSCNPGNYFHSVNNTCLSGCPKGWFANGVASTCDQCYTATSTTSALGSCATCNGANSNNCLTCHKNYFLYSPTSTCLLTCPVGYFQYPRTRSCKQCFQAVASSPDYERTCATCTAELSNKCLSCLSGEYLMPTNSTCLKSCPTIGWYPRTDINECGQCYQATDNEVERTCVTCTGSASTECFSCAQGNYLYSGNNTCLRSCPDGYYADSTTLTCKACFSISSITGRYNRSCKTCSGPSQNECLSCFSPSLYNPKFHTCQSSCSCQGSFYYDSIQQACGSCSASCDFCTGPNESDCIYTDAVNYTCLGGESYSQQNPAAKIYGVITAATSGTTVILSMIIIIASGATAMGALTSLSLIGILGLYQFLNVNYATNVLIFFEYFFSNTFGDFPNLFTFILQPDAKLLYKDTRIQGDNKFNLFIISNLFLKNFGGRLSLILALLAFALVLRTIARVMKKSKAINPSIHEGLQTIRNFIQWNLILSVLIGSFVQMVLSVMLQLRYTTEINNWFGFYSFSLSVTGLVAVIFTLVLLLAYGKLQEATLQKNQKLITVTKVLLNTGFPSQTTISTNTKTKVEPNKRRYWAFAFCTRNFLLVLFISTLSNSPISQCVLSFIVNLALFLAMFKWNFFERKIQGKFMKTCEGINTIIPMLFLGYGVNDLKSGMNNGSNNSSDFTYGIGLGWIIIVLINFITIFTFIFQLIEAYFVFLRFLPWFNAKLQAIVGYITGRDLLETQREEESEAAVKAQDNKNLNTDIKRKDSMNTLQNLVDLNKSQSLSPNNHENSFTPLQIIPEGFLPGGQTISYDDIGIRASFESDPESFKSIKSHDANQEDPKHEDANQEDANQENANQERKINRSLVYYLRENYNPNLQD